MRADCLMLLIAVGLFLSGACQTAPVEESDPGLSADSLSYEFSSIERNRPCADTAKEQCIDISIEKIQITGGISPSLRKQIQTYLNQQISATDNTDQPAEDAEQIADNMVEEYTRIIREMENYKMPWQYYRSFEVYLNENQLFGVQLNAYSFTGGAHPAEFTYFYNFDTHSGELLSLEDLLLPGFYAEMEQEAEKQFRSSREIDTGVSYEEAGYWFEEDEFSLPENYRYTPENLVFLYNPYEIAPYAEGHIRIRFSYKQVRDRIKPEYRF